MALQSDDIIAEALARKFPCVLSDTEWLTGVINPAMRALSASKGVTTYGYFTTVDEMQDYAIFDPNDTITGGFAQNCQGVSNVWFNPSGDFTSIDIFNPGWQLIQQTVQSGSYFHQPSQMSILRVKLDEWTRQFGQQGFEIIGAIGFVSGRLRLFPTPQTEATCVVEYTSMYTLATVETARYWMLWQWLEYYFAETMANYYSQTAGVDLLGFHTPADAMRYWQAQAKFKYTEANMAQRGIHGQVARS